MKDLEICIQPSQWRKIDPERLRGATCAVIDVIRATSTIAAALAHGAGVHRFIQTSSIAGNPRGQVVRELLDGKVDASTENAQTRAAATASSNCRSFSRGSIPA